MELINIISIISIAIELLSNTKDFRIESEERWNCIESGGNKHIVHIRNTGTRPISIKEYGLEIKQYGTIPNIEDIRLVTEEKHDVIFNMNRYYRKFVEAGKPNIIYFYVKTDRKKKKRKIMINYIDD